MDELTKLGLNFIKNNIPLLTLFAHARVEAGCAEDDWFGYDIDKHHQADGRSEVERTVDINLWRADNTGNWHATAYPMEINSAGEVQTNTQDFVELF